MDSLELQDWLKTVLSGLVSNPDEIEIEKVSDEMGVKYTVKVAEEDRGMVIGKGGVNAKAVRDLLRHVGYRCDIRASLVFDMPDKDGYSPRR